MHSGMESDGMNCEAELEEEELEELVSLNGTETHQK